MTTVRVNLLPPEIAQRARQRRLAQVVGALLVVYVGLLGALHAVKLGQVAEARRERDAAQAEAQRLQGQVAALGEFRVLEQTLAERNQLVTTAMAEEVAVARMLNELALQVPATSSLRTLTINLEPPQDPAAAAPAPAPAPATEGAQPSPAPIAPAPIPAAAEEPGTIGELTFEGYSIDRVAPGVETLLITIAGVPSFINTLATASQLEEIGEEQVTAFAGIVEIDDRAYTHRYDDGLPTEGER